MTSAAITRKPKKILHICKVYSPEKGGVQRVVENITALLPAEQHTVLTTGGDGAIAAESRKHTQILRCRSYGQIASMPIAPSMIASIRNERKNHDLIAVHYPFPLVDLAFSLTLSAPPIVIHWHSRVIAQRRLKWITAPFTLLLLWRAKSIVVTSPIMAERSRMLRLFRRKTKFIPYGLPSLHSSSKTTNIKAHKPYLLLIGRHVSYKGIDNVIKALQSNQVLLVIVGDGPLFEKHKKLARECGVLDRIRFRRQLNDKQVSKLLQKSKGLVVPSVMENEAFAIVQLEAMQLAKPIINTNLPSSVPWVARHNQEALTVEPSDVEALSSAMVRLVNDEELASRLGQAGLARFNQHFSGDGFATALGSLYQSLIKQ